MIELFLDCGDDRRVGEADLMDVVSVEIHVAPSLEVFDPDPVAGAHGVQAGGGEGLVEEVFFVLREERPRLFIQVFLLPLLPARGNIDIAFRSVKFFHAFCPPSGMKFYLFSVTSPPR